MEVRKLREWNETETRERFMKLKGGKGYTLADIEALPEGERAELIDGECFGWTRLCGSIKISLWNYPLKSNPIFVKIKETVRCTPRPLRCASKRQPQLCGAGYFRSLRP